MTKFKVEFREVNEGRNGKLYSVDKTIYVELGDKATKRDVLEEIIRRGYKGEVVAISRG